MEGRGRRVSGCWLLYVHSLGHGGDAMATAAAAAVEAVKTLDADRGGLEREPRAGTPARRHGRRRRRRARAWPVHGQPWHGHGRAVRAEPAVVDHRVRRSPRRRAAEQRRLRGRRRQAALVALREEEVEQIRAGVGEAAALVAPQRRRGAPRLGAEERALGVGGGGGRCDGDRKGALHGGGEVAHAFVFFCFVFWLVRLDLEFVQTLKLLPLDLSFS